MLLSSILLRRKKNTKINGKDILADLPPKQAFEIRLKLDLHELADYRAFEGARKREAREIMKGDVGENVMAGIFVLLLRLRQISCHPLLPKVTMNPLALVPSAVSVKMIQQAKHMDQEAIEVALSRPNDPRMCTECGEKFELSCILIMDPCGDSICPTCFKSTKISCPKCDVAILLTAVPWLLLQILSEGHRTDEEIQATYKERIRKERNLAREYESLQDTMRLEKELASLSLAPAKQEPSSLKAPAAPRLLGKPDSIGTIKVPQKIPVAGIRYDQQEIDEIARVFYRSKCFREAGGWVESTKCNAILEALYDVWSEAPEDKVIVFSFFTSFLDVLSIPLDAAGIKYLTYTGLDDLDDRNRALEEFKSNKDYKVLLISLSCGNVGLTLTAANRVFIAEPYWNPYVEDQAKDRVHRIGQLKEVKVYRFICEETVEERILALQHKKRELIESALGEKGNQKAVSMSKSDVLFALGLRKVMR